MVQKKRISQKQANLSGLFLAAVLILISAFLSSIAYQPQSGPLPRIETTGRSVTGLAALATFGATCSDDATIFRAAANLNSFAASYNTATYSKRVCADSSLGSGHTCIYPTTTPSALPTHCSNIIWDGDESDVDLNAQPQQSCGGSCNKCSSSLSCWGNSDCSSGICWFNTATMTKRASASPPITKDQRLQPISTNIQYQGVCVNTAPSTGGIVGGAVVDITGETFGIPSSSFGTPTAPSYCSDGSKSGDESDVDCGGSCFAKCANDESCTASKDCMSNYCDPADNTCKPQSISFPSTTTTAPTVSITPTTTTTTAAQTQINTIIRLGSDNTVEKAGYTGASATTTTPTSVTYTGAIKTCSIKRSDQQVRSDLKCTPQAGPTGTKLLGIIDEYNDKKEWYNGYAIYVSDTIDGEVVKNNDCRSPDCSLPACTKGTLQTEILEYDQDYGSEALVYRKSGICAAKNIKKATCSQLYSTGTRSCLTTAPEQGMTKLESYITDIVNTRTLTRHFHYHDIYIQSQETVQQPVPITYTDVCFGNGPYHYETRASNQKGTCESGSCIFTISADTGGKVADCSTNNAYTTSVCSGGYCAGNICTVPECQDQVSCNANRNCAWDPYEKRSGQSKCKSQAAICNSAGITLCTPAAFRAGDYRCLSKDGNYYTKACVAPLDSALKPLSQFGFWQLAEVY